MKYIAHRGLWKEKSQQNSFHAIKMAFDSGFGVELDVRETKGQLVVSHDPVIENEPVDFFEIVELFSQYDSMLAINVKTDGILSSLNSVLQGINKNKYFLFDMSIPETIGYLKSDLSVFMRISEYEIYGELHAQSHGVWLDAFDDDWWIKTSGIFQYSKPTCVVSPELHGRDEYVAWSFLRELDLHSSLYLCTDYPNKAKEFFQ